MSVPRILIPILIALVAAAGPATAQESTWIVTTGDWGTAVNWDPQSVPDSPGESALIPNSGADYSITLDLNPTVEQIRLLNPSTTIRLGSRSVNCLGPAGLLNHGILRANGSPYLSGHIENATTGNLVVESGRELRLYGPTFYNEGTILLNEAGSGDASINVLGDLDLSGVGSLILNGDSEGDQIYASYSHTLTQEAGHTTRGQGKLGLPVQNHGTIDADRNGGFLVLKDTDKTSDGLLRASGGGLLRIENITLHNGGGTIRADGGDVNIANATIAGGTIDRTGASVVRVRNSSLSDPTIATTGWIDVPSGYTMYLYGSAATNDGTIRVNDTGAGDAVIDARSDIALNGAGEIVLNGDNYYDDIKAYYGHTLTQGSAHTIRGVGGISAPLLNHGLVEADHAGGTLRLYGSGKANDGTLSARSGGLLYLQNFTLNNAGGTIIADGGDVLLENCTVSEGVIDRTGNSVARSRNAWLTNAAIPSSGWLDLPSGYGVYMNGSGITNDGTIRVNEGATGDSWIDIRSDLSLSGSGAILLNGDNQYDDIKAYYGHPLTQEAGHTIRGFGGITAPLVNHGTIDADRAGGFLRLSGYDKRNDSLFRASNNGLLTLANFNLDNNGGTLLADGGNIRLEGCSVVGGSIARSGSSIVQSANASLTGVTIPADGWIDVPTGNAMYLYGPTVTNDGTIRVHDDGSGDATIDIRSDMSLAGGGEILLNGDNVYDAVNAYYGHTLTQGAGHTIRGFGGITAPLVNHGTVDADRAGGHLVLHQSPKANDGLLRASGGGELRIQSITLQNAGGTIKADGGTVLLSNNCAIVGGTIDRAEPSVVRATGAQIADLTIAASGWIDIAAGYYLMLAGAGIMNDGTIRLNDTSSGDSSIDIRPAVDPLTLSGTGQILMNGNSFGDVIYSYYGRLLIQEAGHTIHGKGQITVPFVNRGTVRADSSSYPMRLNTASFNNQGICEASGGAQLQLHLLPQNYASHTLTGGTWIARQNSSIVLNIAPVDTANAAILLDGPNSNFYRDYSSTNGLSGLAKIGPSGSFTIRNGRNFSTAGNLQVEGGLAVAGGCVFSVPGFCSSRGGRILVDGTLTSPNPIDLQLGSLSGTGVVAGDVLNQTAAVEPGSSTDTLRIEGDYTQGVYGRIVVELGGTTADRIDLLEVTGHAILDGILEIREVEGHHVQPGDTYKVMTFGSRQGIFTTLLNQCPEPAVCFEAIYGANDVTLVAHTVAPSDVPEEDDAPENASLPETVRLYAGSTAGLEGKLHLDLPVAARVRLDLYDVAGRMVGTLVDGDIAAGSHDYRLQDGAASHLGNGIYFARATVRCEGGTMTRTTRLWIVR